MTEPASPLVLRALTEIRELKARLAAIGEGVREPIAIIGIGCRFPGADDVPAFRVMLQAGRDAVGDLPAYRRVAGEPAFRGGYLANVDRFDHGFFGVSGREAESMDPQQRLLLEVAWEALEDAGLDVPALAESPTGVFIGSCTNDYARLQLAQAEALNAHMGTGGAASVQAGRIAYALGLQGPALVVDTACSSSLVALHLACASLRADESRLAIVGGVNMILSPDATAIFDDANMLAADGRCKTFDADADGYVRGEGCGVVILKPLRTAKLDGDRILAVVRGSAVNQDGRSTGLTAPNVLSQEALLRAAYAVAGVSPADVGMIEAHGTGTPLGDPIEVDALTRVFGGPRADGAPCHLGSVKTNVGHLEGAAGMAGLLKAILAIRHGEVYPHLHLTQLSPYLSLAGTPFVIPAALAAWATGDRPRQAGVSSFGFSGTNAHVVLEQAPAAPPTPAHGGPALLVLAAKSEAALASLAAKHAAALRALPPREFVEWCREAARRSGQPERLALRAEGPVEAAEALTAFAAGANVPHLAKGRAPARPPGVVFVFAGQGTQYPQMAVELLDDGVFSAELAHVEAVLTPEVGFSVRRALLADAATSELHLTHVAQPAIFAIQLALVAMWRERGILPAAVVGHSIGEVAAACVAGVLSLEQACRVVGARSRAMARPTAAGRMLVASCTREQLDGFLGRHGGVVCLAAENAERSVTAAGEAAAIATLLTELAQADIRTRDLGVAYAFHSPTMDAASREIGAALTGLTPAGPTLPWFSTLSGASADLAAGDATGTYWARQVREPVAFRRGVLAALAAGHRQFLEIGSDAVLGGAIVACARESDQAVTIAASIRRGEPPAATLLASLGALFAAGQAPRWDTALGRPSPGRQASLPTYPWQRERAWFTAGKHARRAAVASGHPWLDQGLSLASPPGGRVFSGAIGTGAFPFLADHVFQGRAVFPGMGHVELMLAAAGAPARLEDLALDALWVLQPGVETLTQVLVTPDGDAGRRVEVFGRQADRWTRYATGRLVPTGAAAPAAPEPLASIRARCLTAVDPAELYRAMGARGLTYGPAFRGLQEVWAGLGEALARVSLPAEAGNAAFGLHPALLDACIQAVWAARPRAAEDIAGTYMPVGLASAVRHQPVAAEVWTHVTGLVETQAGVTADIVLRDAAGAAVAELHGLRVRRMDAQAATGLEPAVVAIAWEPTAATVEVAHRAGAWCLVGEQAGLLGRLAERLREHGDATVFIPTGEDLDGALARACAAQPFQGVVLLPTLSPAAPLEALALVQALGRAGLDAPCTWLMTATQAVSGSASLESLDQAPLWGLGRSVAAEHPTRRPAMIDLSAAPGDDEVAALVRELCSPADEDGIALRGSERFVCRLVPQPLQAPGFDVSPRAIRAGVTYLVTGGLGGLGLGLAEWLAAQGARHLVLLDRSPLTPAEEVTINAMRATGCLVEIATADVGDRAQLAAVLTGLPTAWPPLGGVFHTAGVLDSAPVLTLTPDEVARVFAPEIAGARHLHDLTRDVALDHFVLFSSAAGLLGAAGLASYAAANTFLDALAGQRRASGLAGLSVAWGPWLAIGMTARAGGAGSPGSLASITPAAGFALLGRLMLEEAAQLAVLPFDVPWLRRELPAMLNVPLLKSLPQFAPAATGASRGAFGLALRELPYEGRLPAITVRLRELVAEVLRTEPDNLATDRPLQDLGLDSLLGVDLVGRVEVVLGAQLPPGALLKEPSIAELALVLHDLLTDPEDTLAVLDDLSEEDTDALLARLLAEDSLQ